MAKQSIDEIIADVKAKKAADAPEVVGSDPVVVDPVVDPAIQIAELEPSKVKVLMTDTDFIDQKQLEALGQQKDPLAVDNLDPAKDPEPEVPPEVIEAPADPRLAAEQAAGRAALARTR